MTNSETKNFSQNVSSSYHLEDRNKNIPKLRFKGYNDEWVEYQLGKICKTYSGGTPNVSNLNFYNGLIPFIKSGEIHSNQTAMYITEEGLKNSSAKLVNKGDLLFALYGATSGEVDISKIDGAINQAILCVKSNYINLIFLKEILSFNKNKILCKYLQGGQGNLSADIFKTLKFKFPTLREQEKIASFLTLIDKKIEKQKELVELLKKYKRGLLSQIFSQNLRFKDNNGNDYPAWEEKSLNNIFDTVTDFVAAGSFADLRKNVQYNEKPDFAQLVRTVDLKNNFKNKDFVFVSKSAYKYLWRVNLNEDALILPNIGANIGEVYYIYSFKLPYKNNVLGPNAILLKSSNNNLYYLYSGCLTDNFRKQLFLQVGASGQPKFNKTDFKKIKIKISINIDEQSKISKFLSKIDDKIQQEECKLNNLQTHKQGLLQQMFI